ncbi:hypothetical protein Sjap_004741 [Stephania japonica]|uniref:Uncharacterized protein n=1 Tax=Stephania japonica TaxID=461633 RepID=A0AAP0K2R8_9MAGN
MVEEEEQEEDIKLNSVAGEGGDSPAVAIAAAKKEGDLSSLTRQAAELPAAGRRLGPSGVVPKGEAGEEQRLLPSRASRGVMPSLDSSRDQIGPCGPVNGPGQLTLDQLTRVN